VDPEEEARGAPEFVSRPRHLAFVLGGITFNLLAAFLVMWLALLTATNEGAETPPLSRGPLTAGQLVVKQASVTIATFVPSLRQTLSPDSPRPMLIVHDSLGTGGEMIFSISIFLALLNLLPIPPLDGFRALCISIELVLRREVPKKVLRPVLIAGALFIGAFLVRDLASLGIGTIVSVFNIALERWAERSRGPTEIVGPPTGAFLLERNLKLFDGKSTTNIEPRAGNRFVGLQFSFEGVKTLVPAEYPIEDPGSNRYQPLGVAFGERGPEFYGSSYVERVELRRAPEGAKNLSIKMSGFSGDGPPKLVAEELRQPEIIFLYEVPKDVTQFELQHHSLRHAFKLENSGSIR
jgi:Zn-dependent protease